MRIIGGIGRIKKAIKIALCDHQWRFTGYRQTEFSNKDYIYECGLCEICEVTHIRKPDALNDCIIDLKS